MANFGTFVQALTIHPLFAVILLASRAAYVQGKHSCPPFSCGHLRDVQYPFRRPADPPECGVKSYELVCSDSKAVIHINSGTYYVTGIFNDSFWVVDADLDSHSTCPIPRWNQHPYFDMYVGYLGGRTELLIDGAAMWASFVNCSQEIKNSVMYRHVACLSTNNSFVYVLTAMDSYEIFNLKPSCGYLAAIPLGGGDTSAPENANYADVVKFMRKGFAVRFPLRRKHLKCSDIIFNGRQLENISDFSGLVPALSTENWPTAFFRTVIDFLLCVTSRRTPLFVVAVAITSAIVLVLCITVLCRFLFAPLAVLTFLTYKFWKTRITIDAVEKFLRMQHELGPKRYAYTDFIAITGHFREKLGQGGYGSVYKGVLPGNIHVAVKMLGNSACNGEEFISEVSTIGRIHHVNVVRLLGFCSEDMRRALVYEYMPHGSLDKYIFSSESNFSWDKLNEIALGIARGIDYLHRGCDMQILHFDIKPHNILLDSGLVPKIADFGLAKLYPRDHSLVPVSAARGTIGYIAPEMISRSFGVISCKSDVYSFGMLLLEMAGRRRNADPHAVNSSQAYYPSWVYDRLTRREVREISEAVDMHEVEKKLCIVGLFCIQMRSHERPTMNEVIEMLETGVDDLQMPPKPFFCGDEHISTLDSCYISSELTAISEDKDE